MTTSETALKTLDRDGYAVIQGLLSAEECAAIRAEVERWLISTPTGRNPFEGYRTQRVYNLVGKSRLFDPLIAHPCVTSLCDTVLAPQYQLSSAVAICLGPDEAAQALHYDDQLFPVPRPRPPLVLSAMWAIDDFTEANGATRVIAGSHRWANEHPDAATVAAPVEMPRGSLLVYVGTLWHGGGANRSGRVRVGVNINYNRGWLRQQENQYLGVPREVAAALSETMRRLIGYDVHPPFIGYVDGRHPARTLEAEAGEPGIRRRARGT
jgi:ectoine hydroxylase-related dioxygenase (phytanoyl-CoA dioxygenase family)